jgi:hypothetical protein
MSAAATATGFCLSVSTVAIGVPCCLNRALSFSSIREKIVDFGATVASLTSGNTQQIYRLQTV